MSTLPTRPAAWWVSSRTRDRGPPIDCTIAENSFALPDPLRNLPAPAKPDLAGHGSGGPREGATMLGCPGRRRWAPNENQTQPCDVGATVRRTGSVLDPHPRSRIRRGWMSAMADAPTSCPGIYWIGGGGRRHRRRWIDRHDRGGRRQAVATSAWLRRPRRGVVWRRHDLQLELPDLGRRSVHPQLQRGHDEARAPQRPRATRCDLQRHRHLPGPHARRRP